MYIQKCQRRRVLETFGEPLYYLRASKKTSGEEKHKLTQAKKKHLKKHVKMNLKY